METEEKGGYPLAVKLNLERIEIVCIGQSASEVEHKPATFSVVPRNRLCSGSSSIETLLGKRALTCDSIDTQYARDDTAGLAVTKSIFLT